MWIGRYRASCPKIYSIHKKELNEAEERKVNKNLYEITGLVGKLSLISLRSRYLPVPPVGPTVCRVLYSTHREDSHYREQSRRIVYGRADPRQIVTYFTFFSKGPPDLLVPLPSSVFGQMMHLEEMVAREASERSLTLVDTREPSNQRRKIAIALPTLFREDRAGLPSTLRSLCAKGISGTRELWDQIKGITKIIIKYRELKKYKNCDNLQSSLSDFAEKIDIKCIRAKKNLDRERTSGICCRKIREFLACRLFLGSAALPRLRF